MRNRDLTSFIFEFDSQTHTEDDNILGSDPVLCSLSLIMFV